MKFLSWVWRNVSATDNPFHQRNHSKPVRDRHTDICKGKLHDCGAPSLQHINVQFAYQTALCKQRMSNNDRYNYG